jgi:sugar porter (SP) family MFS transporter
MPPSRGDAPGAGLLPMDLGSDLSKIKMAVFVSSLSTVCLGYNSAIIAGAILYIEKDQAFEPLDDAMEGALVSCALAGAAIGAACGSIADYIGRRRALFWIAGIFIIGPICMALSPNIWLLIAARAVAGLGIGVSSVLVNLYISEIAPAANRGQLGGWAPFLGTLGILVSYLVSAVLGLLPNGAWRFQLGFALVPAILQLLLSRFIPETPRWLLARGRQEEASVSLRQLFPSASAEALEAEIHRIQADPAFAASQANQRVGLCTLCRQHQLPSVLGVSINVLQQVSGINVVIYFGPTILTEAGFSNSGSMIATAMVSVMQLAATAVLIRHVDRIGRRPLALLGILLMMVGLGLLVAAFILQGTPADDSFPWTGCLSTAGMFLFRGAFSLSLGPLPYIMTSEFFPQEARAAGTALSWTSNWASNFGVSLSFPLVVDAFGKLIGHKDGIAMIFCIYIGFCVVAYALVLRMLPETRGLQLEAAAAVQRPADACQAETADLQTS